MPTRSPICARRRAATSPAGDARAGGVDLQRRSAADRRRIGQPGSGDARLSPRARSHAAGAPLLSVWGGKITTFRKLAEEAADRLAPTLRDVPLGAALDRHGDAARRRVARVPRRARRRPRPAVDATFAGLRRPSLTARHASVAPALVRRLARHYGTRAEGILAIGLGDRDRARRARRRARAPARQRVGARRRGRALAPHQARPAPRRGGRAAVSEWMAARASRARARSRAPSRRIAPCAASASRARRAAR